MTNLFISSKKEQALKERMKNLGIHEKNIRESFVRSSGRGGQNVNKASTCVYLKHLPTEIEIKCQRGRSQALNRYYARILLCDKIDSQVKGKKSKEQQRIEKIKRQKRKRSKRAKEKILKEKHHQTEKKKIRTPVKEDENV
jgi:protein subunit release factor B|tara:strand:- start:1043 stop:1465 length:423 start_codon:yes stop_codon:yes gene_type:complete